MIFLIITFLMDTIYMFFFSGNLFNINRLIVKGDLDFVDIEGNEMSCSVEKLGGNFPEKDMFRCTGLLKEKLQEYLINRMHDYVLQNLGEIKENLKQI